MIETEANAPAAPAIEAQEGESPASPAEKDDFTEKFMRLARRERAFQQQQAEFKARMTEFEKQQAEYKEFLDRKSKWKEDPYAFLEANGLKFDELTQAMLEYGKPADPQQEMLERLERLEKAKQAELEQAQKAKEDEIEAERQRTVEGYRSIVEKFIDSGEYELVKANGATDLVMEVMRQRYEHDLKTSGEAKLMELSDACALVEEHLESEIQKLKDLNKVKRLFESKEDPKQSIFGQQASKPQSVSTTLTNSMKAASEAATPQHRKPTNDESLKAAAALIKWNN